MIFTCKRFLYDIIIIIPIIVILHILLHSTYITDRYKCVASWHWINQSAYTDSACDPKGYSAIAEAIVCSLKGIEGTSQIHKGVYGRKHPSQLRYSRVLIGQTRSAAYRFSMGNVFFYRAIIIFHEARVT